MQRWGWSGEFTDGRTAALQEVEVSFDGRFLLIRTDSGRDLTRWDVAEVSTESSGRAGWVHLRCALEPEASLELRGEDVAVELETIGIRSRSLPRSSGRRTLLALALISGIVGAVGLVWISVTPLSRVIAEAVPLELERALGGQLERALADEQCESEPAREVLDVLVVRLAGPDHGLPPVHVLNLEMPNAFALPGGGIVLTRGLLTTAEHPDEIAGILAHEIQHVQQRHVMTALVRGTLLTALWSVTVGDYSGLLVVDPTTAFQIATLQFSREDEESADRGALEMLDAAKIRRDGLSAFFTRLAEDEGDTPEWLSTHPRSEDRAAASVASSALDPATLVASLDDAQWEILVGACQDAAPPESDLEAIGL